MIPSIIRTKILRFSLCIFLSYLHKKISPNVYIISWTLAIRFLKKNARQIYNDKKKLDRVYTIMIPAVLIKSWKQELTKQQLYSYLPPISQTIKHAVNSWWYFFVCVLWHINRGRLFNAKSIFIWINRFISNCCILHVNIMISITTEHIHMLTKAKTNTQANLLLRYKRFY